MVLELVLSGAVGGGLTLVATWGEYYRRQRDRRERTRTALLAELQTMLEPVETWSTAIVGEMSETLANPPVLEANPVVSEVYDARASDLGLFDTDTVERVTVAYSVAKRLERRLERVHDADEVEGSRLFGLLADVVELHLFINLAIRALEQERAEQTDLSWPTGDGEDIRADDVREDLVEKWDLDEVALISFQLDYRVQPPVEGGTGVVTHLSPEEEMMNVEDGEM
jgi:hypothetical protein